MRDGRRCARSYGTASEVQVEQPGGRTDKYGQFVLAVDEVREDPDDLFDRAFSAEQLGDLAEAEKLYRLLMKADPTDASAPFNLGNMLRTASRTVEAEAALRAATRANAAFAEAWYNLADLLDEQGAIRQCHRVPAQGSRGFARLQ